MKINRIQTLKMNGIRIWIYTDLDFKLDPDSENEPDPIFEHMLIWTLKMNRIQNFENEPDPDFENELDPDSEN